MVLLVGDNSGVGDPGREHSRHRTMAGFRAGRGQYNGDGGHEEFLAGFQTLAGTGNGRGHLN